MSVQRFAYDCPVILTELGIVEGVSTNVRFSLDAPISVRPFDFIELDNGQWFLFDGKTKTRIMLNGKWDRLANL